MVVGFYARHDAPPRGSRVRVSVVVVVIVIVIVIVVAGVVVVDDDPRKFVKSYFL